MNSFLLKIQQNFILNNVSEIKESFGKYLGGLVLNYKHNIYNVTCRIYWEDNSKV